METRWLYVTSAELKELREAAKGVCVIPMGCVEKHGLHLPLGTDVIQASAIAYEASKIEPFAVFPDFWFGDFPLNGPNRPAGSLTPKLETEIALLEELADQIAANGFRKILIFNHHGGNHPWVKAFLRKLANRKHDFVMGFTWGVNQAPRGIAEYLDEHGPGSIPELTPEDEATVKRLRDGKMLTGHACMNEAAMVMAIAPECVHLDRLGIEDGHSLHKTDYLKEAGIHIAAGGWDVDYPNNYCGDDPVDLNPRIAKAAFRLDAERLAEIAAIWKNDTNMLKWHEYYWI